MIRMIVSQHIALPVGSAVVKSGNILVSVKVVQIGRGSRERRRSLAHVCPLLPIR